MSHIKTLIDALQPFVLANSSEEFVTLVVRSSDITKARTAIEEAEKQEPDVYGYAKRLAEAIWKKHYKVTAPQWEPVDHLIGVLTQIDNMTSGLITPPNVATPLAAPAPKERKRQSARSAWVGLMDEEKRSVCRVGPVYAPDGVVTRTPLQYRKELEGVALKAVRQAEAKLKEKNCD